LVAFWNAIADSCKASGSGTSSVPLWGGRAASIPASNGPVLCTSQGAGAAFLGGLQGSYGAFRYDGSDGATWSGYYYNISGLAGVGATLNVISGGVNWRGTDGFFGNALSAGFKIKGLMFSLNTDKNLVPMGADAGLQPSAEFALAIGTTYLQNGVMKFEGCKKK